MSLRKGEVFVKDQPAGIIEEDEAGHIIFTYKNEYLNQTPAPPPVSLTMPLQEESYESSYMFPFFDGLIPEGWLLDLTARNWKLDQRDRLGILLEVCHDTIGAVSIKRIQ